MNEQYKGLRTHFLGELRKGDSGSEVTLMGWVAKRRDHGGLIFVDLRDRYGVTQIVFHPQMTDEGFAVAEKLSAEDVLKIVGTVDERPEGTVNSDLDTGEIEVNAKSIELLNESETPPFEIRENVEASEDLRLEYRYLDLRRKKMRDAIITRHKFYQSVRKFMSDKGFIEIETPILTKSTPEGARDFLVPSRLSKGKFYALPQSPQIYKQILMVSGFDKYFQIVKAFRDEDLRADRQPEHTQVDIEMSFVDESHVRQMAEELMATVFKEVIDHDLPLPFPAMTYDEAMKRFGSDKPDLRFGVEIRNVSEIAGRSDFNLFQDAVNNEGIVGAVVAEAKGTFSRKVIDELVEFSKIYGLGGLSWAKVEDGKLAGGVSRHFDENLQSELLGNVGAKDGDVIFLAADKTPVALKGLGAIRLEIGRRLNLIDKDTFSPLWVTDFPMFEWDEEAKRYSAMHHPFTSPKMEDIDLLDSDPSKVYARAYDMVFNGSELGGGSIRIHSKDVQSKVFKAIGIGADEAERKFGYLLKALSYGAPPHGGIALGLDRIVTMLLRLDSIRDVIAFPKTASGTALMEKAPSEVSEAQLKELGIKLEPK
ncbi:aspartate--tRNA ligase [Candidatus Marinimicrobia bacterium MT.SAG.3]|nr:aspartate--tRNA ligase [Candidatus Marinimicrobia bacterium MT.SAG.3]